jgi:cytoskeleton protein RodZ
MPTIGETLRESRMRQRLDIADVEERTKIRAKYLRALENEEFALLPGPTFVKTFLRSYAEVLGLDPHVLVEEYRAGYEPHDDLETQGMGATPGGPPPPPRERRYPGGPPSRATVLGLLAAGVLVLLLVLGLTGNDEDGSQRTGQSTDEAEKRPPRRNPRRPRPVPTGVTVRVTPSLPTYMCVDNGPGTDIVYQGITGDPQTFKGKKIRINLGKSSVELQLNGKPFPIEQTPNAIGYEFSPTGQKELPGGQRPCATPAPS